MVWVLHMCLLKHAQNRLRKSILNSFSRFSSTVVYKSNFGTGCSKSLLQHLSDKYICHSLWQIIDNRWQIKTVLYLTHYKNVSKIQKSVSKKNNFSWKKCILSLIFKGAKIRNSISHELPKTSTSQETIGFVFAKKPKWPHLRLERYIFFSEDYNCIHFKFCLPSLFWKLSTTSTVHIILMTDGWSQLYPSTYLKF